MAKKKGSTHLSELFDDEGYTSPSRSQLKRDSVALQKIGEDLALLPKTVWDKFTLSIDLKAALHEYTRIPSREGRRRQLQFIGRLMREENSPLVAQELSAYKANGAIQVESFHHLEALRNRLLGQAPADAQAARQEVEALFPHLDSKQFELLLQAARNSLAKPGNSDKLPSRALFRYLKSLQNSAPKSLETLSFTSTEQPNKAT